MLHKNDSIETTLLNLDASWWIVVTLHRLSSKYGLTIVILSKRLKECESNYHNSIRNPKSSSSYAGSQRRNPEQNLGAWLLPAPLKL